MAEQHQEAKPIEKDVMGNLLEQVGEEELNNLEKSQRFTKISQEDFEKILSFIQSNKQFSDFVIVGRSNDQMPKDTDITISTTGPQVKSSSKSLEESWVMLEETEGAKKFVAEHPNLQKKPSIFDNWPSFGVYNKMSAVMTATGASFCFGYVVGAKAALDSLYRLAENKMAAAGLTLATALGTYLAPRLAFRAVQYIIVGGLLGGGAMAAPVFVVGTTGVFVTSTIYHAYILARRAGSRALAEH
eukprot:TRINITY_DN12347_c0_g1_i1.p1 TRINITY_DN12347_c0_g1~~TRINITY_DN12347_c0_g1_i1.p1  ORF type:complete len:279 (-),score=22.84 TRINITY_DN12347_c0_g1_i1:66-797(-)